MATRAAVSTGSAPAAGVNDQDSSSGSDSSSQLGSHLPFLRPHVRNDVVFLASEFVATRGEFGFTFSQAVSAVGAYFNQFQATAGTTNLLVMRTFSKLGMGGLRLLGSSP